MLTVCDFIFHVAHVLVQYLYACGCYIVHAEQVFVYPDKYVGIIADSSAKHDSINVEQVVARLGQTGNSAVNDDFQVRKIPFQPVNQVVLERRDRPVLPGAQSVQPGLAGVDDERTATGFGNSRNKPAKVFITVVPVNTDPCFDSNRTVGRRRHRCDTFGNQGRFCHEACAETA